MWTMLPRPLLNFQWITACYFHHPFFFFPLLNWFYFFIYYRKCQAWVSSKKKKIGYISVPCWLWDLDSRKKKKKFLEKEKQQQSNTKKKCQGSIEVVWIMMAPCCAWKSSVWTVTCLKLAVWMLETLVKHKVFIKIFCKGRFFLLNTQLS